MQPGFCRSINEPLRAALNSNFSRIHGRPCCQKIESSALRARNLMSRKWKAASSTGICRAITYAISGSPVTMGPVSRWCLVPLEQPGLRHDLRIPDLHSRKPASKPIIAISGHSCSRRAAGQLIEAHRPEQSFILVRIGHGQKLKTWLCALCKQGASFETQKSRGS